MDEKTRKLKNQPIMVKKVGHATYTPVPALAKTLSRMLSYQS